MKCDICQRDLRPLFRTYYCEYCDTKDSDTPPGTWYSGWVCYRPEGSRILNYCVFPNRKDTEKWKAVNDIKDGEVREVYSETPFTFKKSSGILKGISIADSLYEVYPDHKYDPKPYRAFVKPLKP